MGRHFMVLMMSIIFESESNFGVWKAARIIWERVECDKSNLKDWNTTTIASLEEIKATIARIYIYIV